MTADIFFLMVGLLLCVTGCRLNCMEPEGMQKFLDGVVEDIGDSQITDDKDLIGAKVLTDGADTYAGDYTEHYPIESVGATIMSLVGGQ